MIFQQLLDLSIRFIYLQPGGTIEKEASRGINEIHSRRPSVCESHALGIHRAEPSSLTGILLAESHRDLIGQKRYYQVSAGKLLGGSSHLEVLGQLSGCTQGERWD